MSLMKSLARVAAGVMLAKGVGSMMRQTQQGHGRTASSRQTGGGILGDLLGGAMGGGMGGGMGAGMGGRSTAGQGGLGDILGGLVGGAGAGAAAGSLGGLLGGLLNGPAQRGAQQQNDASFGELFNDALARQDEPEVTPTAEQNAIAGLMLRAMIQAAKADGKIDEAERERLLGQMGDLDDEDRAFIREQMAAPVDAQALAREVPKGLEPQVYMMSLMAIDFDNRTEAEYLNSLAQAMGIDGQVINQIHQHVGVQDLYS